MNSQLTYISLLILCGYVLVVIGYSDGSPEQNTTSTSVAVDNNTFTNHNDVSFKNSNVLMKKIPDQTFNKIYTLKIEGLIGKDNTKEEAMTRSKRYIDDKENIKMMARLNANVKKYPKGTVCYVGAVEQRRLHEELMKKQGKGKSSTRKKRFTPMFTGDSMFFPSSWGSKSAPKKEDPRDRQRELRRAKHKTQSIERQLKKYPKKGTPCHTGALKQMKEHKELIERLSRGCGAINNIHFSLVITTILCYLFHNI